MTTIEGEKMMIPEENPEQLIRAENPILADIWDALWKEDSIAPWIWAACRSM
jgi:hypothetical protein